MARWWSSTRKPSTSSGENDTAGTGRSEGAASASSSRLKRTLFRSHRSKKEEAAAAAAPRRDLEPPPPPPPFASRPFTQQNLEHQKILGAFTWTTGGRRPRKPSRGAHSYASGVSPSTSRTTSVDDLAGSYTACPPLSPTRAPADRRSLSGCLRRSLAAADGPPRESLPGGGGGGGGCGGGCGCGGESEQGHVPTAVLPGGVSNAHRRS